MKGSNVGIWSWMAKRTPLYVWNPLPNLVFLSIDDLNIFTNPRFTFTDVRNYFVPNFMFPFPVLWRNKLVTNMVDSNAWPSDATIPRPCSILNQCLVLMVLH